MLRIDKRELEKKNQPAGTNGAEKCQIAVDMTQRFIGNPDQGIFQIETPIGRFFTGASFYEAPFFQLNTIKRIQTKSFKL